MSHTPETAVSIGIGLSILAIFALDVAVASDDVSIAFLYAFPLLVSMHSGYRDAYKLAAVTTLLSVIGSMSLPSDAGASFVGNRMIAIITQWIVAALVVSRRSAEQLLHQKLDDERQKTERQRRFLDIVSHEIGTSLTTIDGHAFRLGRRSTVIEPAETGERVGKIRGAVRHIQALMQHIQLVAEIEDEALRPQRSDVSLAAVVDDSVARVRQAYPRARIDVATAALPATLRLDAFMISQVVENIVSNAVKYSPFGSPISITGETTGDTAILTVADRGRGIPPEDLERVFAVYYRAQNSHDMHGTGVGLYVAERFAAAHDGTVTIDSRLGVGTVAILRLPLAMGESV